MAVLNLSSWISGSASAICYHLSLIAASFLLSGTFARPPSSFIFFLLFLYHLRGTSCIDLAKWTGVIKDWFVLSRLGIFGKGWGYEQRHFLGTKCFLWEKVTNLLGFCREDGDFFLLSGLLLCLL